MDLNPKTKLLLTLFGIGTFLIPATLWFLTAKFIPQGPISKPAVQTESGLVAATETNSLINSTNLLRILDSSDLVLFDLSNEEVYRYLHIKGAININLEEFRKIVEEEPLLTNDLKQSQIVVYCTDNCSTSAFLKELSGLNLTQIKVFNSFLEWRNLGYPLEP